MTEEEQGDRSSRLIITGALSCAGIMLVCAAIVFAFILSGPDYPRDKAAAFERLKAAGPELVVTDGRAVLAKQSHVKVVAPGNVPARIAELRPVKVERRSGQLYIWMGGGGLVGDYGFLVSPEGAADGEGLKIVDGLHWKDAHDAPKKMQGLPPGW